MVDSSWLFWTLIFLSGGVGGLRGVKIVFGISGKTNDEKEVEKIVSRVLGIRWGIGFSLNSDEGEEKEAIWGDCVAWLIAASLHIIGTFASSALFGGGALRGKGIVPEGNKSTSEEP